MTFLATNNGRARRIPISSAVEAVLGAQPRIHAWVFTNARGKKPRPFTVGGVRHVFDRAAARAHLTNVAEVTLHTLRHTALSRMIAAGHDYTVTEIAGQSSTRMLPRYTHRTEERKTSALNLPPLITQRSQTATPDEISEFLRDFGGRQEARTPDLRVANAALSQLS